jgi:Ni/Co efflux regulator RcnB
MRTGTLVALCGAAMLALVGVSHAAPLSASGATSIAIEQAFADEGATQVRHRKRWRHYGWHRGHHHGWRHRHYHRPAYGYYRPHYRRGVTIRF